MYTCVTGVSPFRLATSPGFHVTRIPKGNLVYIYIYIYAFALFLASPSFGLISPTWYFFTVRSLLRCYVLLGSTLTFYSLPSIPLLILFHLRRKNLYR